MPKFLISYLEISLPVSVLIISLLLSKSILNKRYLAKTRYYIWLILALRLLFPFDLPAVSKSVKPVHIEIPKDIVYYREKQPVPKENIDENLYNNIINSPSINKENNIAQNKINSTVNKTSIVYNEPKTITVSDILLYIWIGGFILMSIYFTFQNFILKRRLSKYSDFNNKYQIMLNSLANSLNIKNSLNVYECRCISSPVIVGIINPKIYIPKFNLSTEMLNMMLYHELVHYKRKDILYKLIMLCCCTIHWFNPFVWIMSKEAERDIEISCDEEVIRDKSMDFCRLYSDSIMNIIKNSKNPKPVLATGFADNKKTLATRFKNIFDRKNKKSGKSIVVISFTLCLVCSVLVACDVEKPLTITQIPDRAMSIMEFYARHSADNNLYSEDKADLGFKFLYEYGYIPHDIEFIDNGAVYKTSKDKLLRAYQFLLADEIPRELYDTAQQEIFYNNTNGIIEYDVTLSPVEIKQTDRNTISVLLDRYYDGILFDRINFVMEKQKITDIPQGLETAFNKDDIIWRIKEINLQSVPSRDSVVYINTASEFLTFASNVTANPTDSFGVTYKLTSDIDFKGAIIEPVGYVRPDYDGRGTFFNELKNNFMGTFDGQGHTISNFVIKYEINTQGNYYSPAGLFSGLSRFGTIKNLNIENGVVEPAGRTYIRTGILTGECYGTIENCNISGSVHGNQCVGALSGDAYGPYVAITNCTVNATVKGENETGLFVGVIGGGGVIQNCTATGKVTGYRSIYANSYSTAPWRIAGFSGACIGGIIKDCHTDAIIEILHPASNVGAFSGSCESGTMTGCTYNINKTGKWKPVHYINESSPDVTAIN